MRTIREGRPLLAGLLLLLAAAAPAAERVENPEEPAEGEVVYELREAWRLGGSEDDEVFFGVVPTLVPDADGNLYLLDSQLSEIVVVSPDGEVAGTLGREGEGPGEFRNGGDLFWAPDGSLGVIQNWPGKIVLIARDGTPGPPFALPFRDGNGFQAASRGAGRAGRIVLSGTAWTREGEQQFQLAYLKAYDLAGRELAHYVETRRETAFGGWDFQEESWVDFQRRWDAAPDGRVAAALAYRDHAVHVWRADGTLDRVVVRPGHEPVARTAAERAGFQAMFERFTSWNPGSTFAVSDVHQAVQEVRFHRDGTLWVQDAAARWRSPAGVAGSWDVHDADGTFVRRVVLRGDVDPVRDGVFWVGERVYAVTDLLSAVMASAGVDTDLGGADPQPVALVAYDLAPADAP